MKDFGDLRSLCAEYRWHAAGQLAHELGAHALQYYADMVSGWAQLPSMEWVTSVAYSTRTPGESVATVEGITSRLAYRWSFELVTSTEGVYVRSPCNERVRYMLRTFGVPKFDDLHSLREVMLPPPPTHVFYHADRHTLVFECGELVVVLHHISLECEVYPDE